jgi:hypothetical protein
VHRPHRRTAGLGLLTAFDVGEKDSLGADHLAGVGNSYRPHVDQEGDRLLIAALGEKIGGLAKNPVVFVLCGSCLAATKSNSSCICP